MSKQNNKGELILTIKFYQNKELEEMFVDIKTKDDITEKEIIKILQSFIKALKGKEWCERIN